MIRAHGSLGDGELIVIGLSEENVRRLKQGEPMTFRLSEMGHPEITMLIVYGETEAHIITDLQTKMGAGDVIENDMDDHSEPGRN